MILQFQFQDSVFLYYKMEYENGITMEDKRNLSAKTHVGGGSALEVNKEKQNSDSGDEASNLKETSKHVAKAEGLSSSGKETEAAVNVSANKITKRLKVQCAIHPVASLELLY